MKRPQFVARAVSFSQSRIPLDRERVFVLSPGILLVVLGISVLLFPRLFLFLLASFFLLIGAFLCFAAWKFIQFKRRILGMARDLDAKIIVQGIHVPRGPQPSSQSEEIDVKKIILH